MSRMLHDRIEVGALAPPHALNGHERKPPLCEQPVYTAGNRILCGLPPQDRARLLAGLQPVSFALGDVVYESGDRQDHIYFPTTCVVSSIYTTEDGATAEIGLVGNDGVVGMPLFLGGETSPNKGVVVVTGSAYKMRVQTLREEFAAGGALQWLLLRYTQAFITQISQAAVCNRLHTVEQRLCRWLLMCHDRVQTDDLRMTQEQPGGVDASRGTIGLIRVPLRSARRCHVPDRRLLEEQPNAVGMTAGAVVDFLLQCRPTGAVELTRKRLLHLSQCGCFGSRKYLPEARTGVSVAGFDVLQPALGLLAQ